MRRLRYGSNGTTCPWASHRRPPRWAYARGINAEGGHLRLTTPSLEEAHGVGETIAIRNRGEVVGGEPTPQLLRRLDTRNVVVTPEGELAALPQVPGFEVTARANGAFATRYRKVPSSVEQVLAAVPSAGSLSPHHPTRAPGL